MAYINNIGRIFITAADLSDIERAVKKCNRSAARYYNKFAADCTAHGLDLDTLRGEDYTPRAEELEVVKTAEYVDIIKRSYYFFDKGCKVFSSLPVGYKIKRLPDLEDIISDVIGYCCYDGQRIGIDNTAAGLATGIRLYYAEES